MIKCPVKVRKVIRLLLIFTFFFCTSFTPPKPTVTWMVPMRDGTLLPTDFYFPSDKPWEHPCVLLRSPAGRKNPFALYYLSLLEHDYVVAIQDTRSAIDQEGKTFPFWHDGWGESKDGYDTIEWIAGSPFANGKVGTVGVSALGISQYMLAPTAPPSLKCQYIGMAAPSIYHHAIYQGGQVQKELVESWLSWYASDAGVHSFATNQFHYNDFWSRFNAMEVSHQVKVPAVHYGGWYDIFLPGTLDAFSSIQNSGGEGAKGKQKLLIGPWTHLWPKDVRYGEFEMPPGGINPPVDLSHVSWLNYHLKGMDNGMEQLHPVTYYVMGPFDGSESSGNVWKHADVWPVPFTELPFYLSSDKQLLETPQENKEVLSYSYDPQAPIPTLGGRNLFMESGPKDQRPIEARSDILIFTSAPLNQDLEITGEIKATLYLLTDGDESDVVVRLTDVYPDGKSILITEGIKRVPSGEQEVILAPTSIVFAKGHQLRVSISSSNYPRYEKNARAIDFKLAIGKDQPSHILLPKSSM